MTDNKYKNCKICKVLDNDYNLVYYGSTIESLARRFSKHRRDYLLFKEGKISNITVFQIFDEYNTENCKIELVENFPCESKEQLRKREGEYIKQDKECVNRVIPGRSRTEYKEDNKDKLKDMSKEYYIKHREALCEKSKQYREEHKDEKAESNKKYREDHPEHFKQHRMNRYFNNREQEITRSKTYRSNNLEKSQ